MATEEKKEFDGELPWAEEAFDNALLVFERTDDKELQDVCKTLREAQLKLHTCLKQVNPDAEWSF